MPWHEFECKVHGIVEVKLRIGEATGDFRPCPECGRKSKHVFPRIHKMLLDRATMRKHAYPAESGMDGPDRPSLRDPDFMEKAREEHQRKVNKRKGRKIFTGDLGAPTEPLKLLPPPRRGSV